MPSGYILFQMTFPMQKSWYFKKAEVDNRGFLLFLFVKCVYINTELKDFFKKLLSLVDMASMLNTLLSYIF